MTPKYEDFLYICHRTIDRIGLFPTLLLRDDIYTHMIYFPLYYHSIYRVVNMSSSKRTCKRFWSLSSLKSEDTVTEKRNAFICTLIYDRQLLVCIADCQVCIYCEFSVTGRINFVYPTILNDNMGQIIWNGVIFS